MLTIGKKNGYQCSDLNYVAIFQVSSSLKMRKKKQPKKIPNNFQSLILITLFAQ